MVTTLILGACGGGGDGGPAAAAPEPWQQGVFAPMERFAAICENPRRGTNPFTGQPFSDMAGSNLHEKNWLRAWTHELYLWFDEVPDVDPAASLGTLEYFHTQKTGELTRSGQPKDRFHFTASTASFTELLVDGTQLGYGASWVALSLQPPREVLVAFVEPGSPAAQGALRRGEQVVAVDGVDLVNANDPRSIDLFNRALNPSAVGQRHVFSLRALGGVVRDVTLSAASIVVDPVPMTAVLEGGSVGYLLFNEHLESAEAGLVAAITTLRDAGVSDLVLDLRYNGGGIGTIANQLAYMVAGNARTEGRVFEQISFNRKHEGLNPYTGKPLLPTLFHNRTLGFSRPANEPLPSLDLGRVFVLTGPGTCSASELIINSLRGIGVEVIQIGGVTCGKPYGFFPTDNCGTAYFSIQIQSVNEQGFGDYPDGFAPEDFFGASSVSLPGCTVDDDYSRELGDPVEAQLAAALEYRRDGRCGAFDSAATAKRTRVVNANGQMLRPTWRDALIHAP